MSHELRTPIANLSGYLHALKSGHIDGDEKLFTALYDQTDRLTKMVEQIEGFNEWSGDSLANDDTRESVQIKDVIAQAVKMFSWKIEQVGLPIQTDVERADIYIDEEGIEQVISILLDNAVRYNEGEEPITVTGTKKKSKYVVSVTTAGEEISVDDKKHIFDRFYRVEHSRSRDTGGSGLGLAIAKEIIESHAGEIKLESAEESNTFTFILPL